MDFFSDVFVAKKKRMDEVEVEYSRLKSVFSDGLGLLCVDGQDRMQNAQCDCWRIGPDSFLFLLISSLSEDGGRILRAVVVVARSCVSGCGEQAFQNP